MSKRRKKPKSKQPTTSRQVATSAAQSGGSRTRWLAAGGLAIIFILLLGWRLSSQQTAQPAMAVSAEGLSSTWINTLNQLPAGRAESVEVAYFHRTQRCVSCKKAEQFIRKTMDIYFVEQMASGAVRLVVADVQKSQDAAATRKYNAFTSSLYLGVVKDGVEYLCPIGDLWTALNDEARFMALLRDRINVALGDG